MALRSLPLILAFALAPFASAPFAFAQQGGDAAPQSKPQLSPLRIHYAGDAGTPHAKSFEAFLSQHFGKVASSPVLDLAKTDLSQADVLIVDGNILDSSDPKQPKILPSPKGLSLAKLNIPTILIGGMGGRIADDLNFKLGWNFG